MNDIVEFNVTTKIKDTYDFLLWHVYGNFRGWIGVMISVVAFILLITGDYKNDDFRILMLGIIAALFTIIQPLQLLFKAIKQVKLNPNADEPLYYVMDQEGIHVRLKKEEMTLPWENVVLVKKSARSLFIYSSRIHAFIIPKAAVIEKYTKICEIIKQYAPKGACKIK